MFLFVWFLLGATLAWLLAAGWTTIRSCYFGYASVPTEIWWPLTLIALCILAALAFASDNALLAQQLLELRSHFLGPRFEVLLLGFIIGVIAFYNRRVLDSGLKRLGTAIIGDKDSTAWALQSAVAIVIVVFLVFAVRPDFFDYLRSFKVGGFEATFAERTNSTIRDTDYHLRDQRDLFIVDQYDDFEAVFIDPASPRGSARRLFAPSALIDETDPIAVMLVDKYLWPVLGAVSCYRTAHQLDLASHDTDVASFLYSWQQLLLSIRIGDVWSDDQSNNDTDRLKRILTRIKLFENAIVLRADRVQHSCLEKLDTKKAERAKKAPAATCQSGSKTFLKDIVSQPRKEKAGVDEDADVPEVNADLECLQKHFKAARAILKQMKQDTPQVAAVIIFDSYLATAIGDLAQLVSGQQKESANFLTNMLDGFPKSEELIIPGLISAFYVMSEAKVETLALWPLEPTVSEINYSLKGVEMMIARSAQCLDNLKSKRAAQLPSPDDVVKPPPCDEAHQKLWSDIYNTYLRNLLIVLSTKIKYFNEIELSGRLMTESSRQEWADALGRLVALLKARLETSIGTPENLPVQVLDERKKRRLPLPILGWSENSDVLFDAEQVTALSLILFEGRAVRPSAQACNLSLFLLNDAGTLTERIKKQLSLERPQEMRWQQLLNVVAQRVAASCSWVDRRGQGQDGGKEPSNKEPSK